MRLVSILTLSIGLFFSFFAQVHAKANAYYTSSKTLNIDIAVVKGFIMDFEASQVGGKYPIPEIVANTIVLPATRKNKAILWTSIEDVQNTQYYSTITKTEGENYLTVVVETVSKNEGREYAKKFGRPHKPILKKIINTWKVRSVANGTKIDYTVEAVLPWFVPRATVEKKFKSSGELLFEYLDSL